MRLPSSLFGRVPLDMSLSCHGIHPHSLSPSLFHPWHLWHKVFPPFYSYWKWWWVWTEPGNNAKWMYSLGMKLPLCTKQLHVVADWCFVVWRICGLTWFLKTHGLPSKFEATILSPFQDLHVKLTKVRVQLELGKWHDWMGRVGGTDGRSYAWQKLMWCQLWSGCTVNS